MANRYYVDRVDNHGSLIEANGTPRKKQLTWGVFDRLIQSGEGHRCVLDVDSRVIAREKCRELNAEHNAEPSVDANGCACIARSKSQ